MTDGLSRGIGEFDFLTEEDWKRLLQNGHAAKAGGEAVRLELEPVVMLFTPDAACTWLLSEVDPDDPETAFGLCDLGMGYPELDRFRLSELTTLSEQLGLVIERRASFVAAKSIGRYALEARITGHALGNVLDKSS
jgi:hypothetical protein